MEKMKVNKKPTNKVAKKTTKPAVKKTTTKEKKKKKGFTLIELLAVIIILGILMIIAIPSVTRYINDSRKSAYIDTAKEVVSGTRNIVNEGRLGMYDTNTTYYVPAKYVNTENSLKSPYGEFTDTSAYVGVIYDGTGYKYYWISSDDAGQGINEVTPLDKLDTDLIKSDLNPDDILSTIETTGIGNRTEIKILDMNGTWRPILLSNANNNVSEEGGNNNNGPKTAAQQISTVEGLEEIAEAKRYVGSNPSNYVTFNNGESWRIIGVYGNQLKIIKTTRAYSEKKYNNSTSDGHTWNGCLLETLLNNEYYNGLDSTAKDMIDSNAKWYVGEAYSYITANEFYESNRLTEWTGKVGVLAPYEYLYAAGINCRNVVSNYSNFVTASGCSSNDWLKPDYDSWHISPTKKDGYMDFAAGVYANGALAGFYMNGGFSSGYSVYPVVYLKSSVKITGGTGTSGDPYTLGL